tara:strand:+ start:168 stop:1019 length:852 start_codon:yes stop_codon:yes gene_type:complete
MKPLDLKELGDIPKLKMAVIGHIEWMKFLSVDELPKPGRISHSKYSFDAPAGGGALTALEMQRLTNEPVHFFTALGKDSIGEMCYKELVRLGLVLHVAWRESSTRTGISFVDSNGERAITVIGERLQPTSKDKLPWEELHSFDGIFISATDSETIELARKAKLIATTPRIGIKTINNANVRLDLLIGSGLDPGEKYEPKDIQIMPSIRIATAGSSGGEYWPGGKFQAVKLKSEVLDTYGCGDKFAAGVTTGIAANWDIKKALSLGANCGAICATYFGPYSKDN